MSGEKFCMEQQFSLGRLKRPPHFWCADSKYTLETVVQLGTPKNISAVQIETHQQWQELRSNVIGASEVAALVGVHEYLTYYGLWATKCGKLPKQDDTGPMERGRRLEPIAVDVIRDQHPQWKVFRPNHHFSNHELGVGATPDLMVEDGERGLGVVQIKSVAPSIFRHNWRGESSLVTPPIWIVMQALMEAHLTGASWAAVAALVVDHQIDLHLVEVPMHQGIIDKLLAEAEAFWRLVRSGNEPDPDFKRDGEIIRQLLKQDDGREIDLRWDNELPELLDEREMMQRIAKGFDEQVKAINTKLLHRIGTAQVARIQDGYISAKTVNRKAYEVPASSYRALRVVRPNREGGA